jgi:hypothetical protein
MRANCPHANGTHFKSKNPKSHSKIVFSAHFPEAEQIATKL